MLRLIETIAGLAGPSSLELKTPSSIKPQSGAPAPIKASGHLTLRHVDLSSFEAIEVSAEADCVWRPGPPAARVKAHASFFKVLRLEIRGRRLVISASAPLIGGRPIIELSSSRLIEVRVSGFARIEAQDVEAGRLIATATDRASAFFSGEAAEAHFEVGNDGVIDAASLMTFIAAAELRDRGMIFLRAREAIDADLRDDAQLLAIGSPRVFEARRHEAPNPKRPKPAASD